MSVDSEVLRVVEYIDDTKMATAAAVRQLWSQLHFSDDEATELQQKGFGAQVNVALISHQARQSLRRAVTISQPVSNEITAPARVVPVARRVEPQETRIISVMRILEETSYDIHGVRTAVANFGVDDCAYRIEQSRAAIGGHERQLAIFEYISGQLQGAGVQRIRELPIDELIKIAKMLARVQDIEEGGPEPSGPPIHPDVPPKFGPVGEGAAGSDTAAITA